MCKNIFSKPVHSAVQSWSYGLEQDTRTYTEKTGQRYTPPTTSTQPFCMCKSPTNSNLKIIHRIIHTQDKGASLSKFLMLDKPTSPSATLIATYIKRKQGNQAHL